MFWGLVLEPSKRYTQKVQQSFHISQAALEINTADFEPVQLILEYDGANYILATLSRKFNVYQIPLDLNFNTGDQISFRTIGKGRVHLTGYHILEDDLEDMVLNGEEQSDLEEEEEEEESSPSKLDSSKQVKRKKPDSSKNVNNKKSKLSGKNEVEASDEDSDDEDAADDFDVDMSDSDDEDDGEEEDDECEEEEDDDDEDDEDDDDDMELGDADEDEDDEELEEENTEGKKKQGAANKLNKSNVSINGKSPKSKKPTNDSKSTPKPDKKNAVATPGKDTKEKEVKTPKSEKKSPKSEKKGKENKGGGGGESSPQKKVLEGGVIVEELKTGEGQAAKPGKMAQVYYVGRLQSNKKQFDATTQGPGFRFRLGKGEVIRGWDIGVCGMKVGGKRRITIPPQLAYGAKGAPPAIPPNSTLVFEVELKGLN